MKDIPGYEIVEGGCIDCDIQNWECKDEYNCKPNKIYKKKEEPNTIEDIQEVNISVNEQKAGKKNMRKIDGYKQVKGYCYDCELRRETQDGRCYEYKKYHCCNSKIYKKKEEKTMTLKETIGVLQAFKEKKALQMTSPDGKLWLNISGNPSFRDILNEITDGSKLRVKPEPKAISWTADDWRVFKDIKIEMEGITLIVDTWCSEGIWFKNKENLLAKYFYYYVSIIQNKDTNGRPCGKVVEE